MDVLVDSSVWIDYFRSGVQSDKLDFLIDENLVCTNDLILTELLPLLIIKKQRKLVDLLLAVRNYSVEPNWLEIREFQVACLKDGSSGVGIPDLIITQNCIQNNIPIYTLDKHFTFICDAQIGLTIYS